MDLKCLNHEQCDDPRRNYDFAAVLKLDLCVFQRVEISASRSWYCLRHPTHLRASRAPSLCGIHNEDQSCPIRCPHQQKAFRSRWQHTPDAELVGILKSFTLTSLTKEERNGIIANHEESLQSLPLFKLDDNMLSVLMNSSSSEDYSYSPYSSIQQPTLPNGLLSNELFVIFFCFLNYQCATVLRIAMTRQRCDILPL